MKLIPKAKPIRIRIVSGGEEHSSIETLRNNYSLDDLLPLVKDGRLHKWLLRVGETKAAEYAYILIGSNTYANSKDMVNLTASIFNIQAKNIEDLQSLWQKQYPKSFFNYVKAYGGTFKDISEARKLYCSINGDSLEMSGNKWREIFIATLRRMPLLAVLEDFKKFKSAKPMHVMAWLKVLSYHAESASDKELYLIAQAAYEYPGLKDEAVQWYLKSAKTYIKAKEWVNKNVKRELPPKEKELFDSFEKDPSKFGDLFFNGSYPIDLVRFLKALSTLYRTGDRPYIELIAGKGDYTKYLYILQKLHNVNLSSYRKEECVRALKQLPNNVSTAYYFQNYKTLDKIISSLEKEEPIIGVRLWECSYRQLIMFIAGLAKIELEHEQ
ncbi:MAG: hypothetical protein K2K98_02370 [Muribaculaceae bacterium]|nr:hypothetical protein [Muribaculaceae bacterium]